MTIAVGLRCDDGVVLAADSEICLGPGGKKYEAKFHKISGFASIYMIYAGSVDFAEELAATLRKAVQGKKGTQLIKSIRTAYGSVWREHHTEPITAQKTLTDLLFTINEGSRISLFRASGNRLIPVKTYSVLGIGIEKAQAVFSTLYRTGMSSTLAGYMAIYGLGRIKGLVQGCGGGSRVWKITNSVFDQKCLSESDVARAEEGFVFFEREFSSVMFNFPDPQVDNEHFQTILKRFATAAKRRRTAMIKRCKVERPAGQRSFTGASMQSRTTAPLGTELQITMTPNREKSSAVF
jgi:20S proteasome alpha/beta subunit